MKKLTLLLLVTLSTVLYSQEFPNWYPDAYSVYDQDDYVAASAVGTTAKNAETAAISNLSKIFGLTITSDYEEDTIFLNDTLSEHIQDSTKIVAAHDLINVRIDSVVYNSRAREYYAVAVMHKASTIPIIKHRVENNILELNRKLSDAHEDSNMFKKYSILYEAASLSYKTEVYLEQLIVIGEFIRLDDTIKSSTLYSAAKNILDNISYGVSSQTENSLIQHAIEATIGNLGMNISNNPTYTFKEKLSYDGTDTGFGMYIVNYSLILELFDSQEKYLTSFTFTGKDGGANEDDAKKVIRKKLARDISESLAPQLTNYLESLIN